MTVFEKNQVVFVTLTSIDQPGYSRGDQVTVIEISPGGKWCIIKTNNGLRLIHSNHLSVKYKEVKCYD